MSWQYSAHNRCIFNWDPSSQEPLESCGWWLWPCDVQFGKHCTVNFIFRQLPPAHGWFPKYPFPPPIFPWCVILLTLLLPWTQSSWRQNFPSSLFVITNYNLNCLRHSVMVDIILICSVLIYTICCHFSSRILESGFSCLHCQTIAVVYSGGIDAFSCPPFLFSHSLSSLVIIFSGTWEQPPNLLCQVFQWPCCLIHYQSLMYCV